ncbi:MAG: NAD(P)/FAD-dependent oxidoreductase [Candidatus Omnitrophota bacterium]
MQIYDVAIIGAGPAGIMAALQAVKHNKTVVLIERNHCIGKKLLLTGKGRCNLTNSASIDAFIEKFGKKGRFLRTAFHSFFNRELIDFFESRGLKLKTERQGRVFPANDEAQSVVNCLLKALMDSKVKILYNTRIIGLVVEKTQLRLQTADKKDLQAKKVILATGGASYKATGSTGDGFDIAKKLGHAIAQLDPALVPLATHEKWVKKLQGLSLKNVKIAFPCGAKNIASPIGEMMFTHFGVSGPLVLDLSGDIMPLLAEHKKIPLLIDLKPGLTKEQLDQRLLNDFSAEGNVKLKSIMKDLLPQKLIPVFLGLCELSGEDIANQTRRDQRRKIIDTLKAMPLTITGALPLEEAMVTAGGVSTKDINPRTMESKITPNLYFAGEAIEGCASSGGYNLQQAFSTGYLAGESAANA